jgi:hypothetical protein
MKSTSLTFRLLVTCDFHVPSEVSSLGRAIVNTEEKGEVLPRVTAHHRSSSKMMRESGGYRDAEFTRISNTVSTSIQKICDNGEPRLPSKRTVSQAYFALHATLHQVQIF